MPSMASLLAPPGAGQPFTILPRQKKKRMDWSKTRRAREPTYSLDTDSDDDCDCLQHLDEARRRELALWNQERWILLRKHTDLRDAAGALAGVDGAGALVGVDGAVAPMSVDAAAGLLGDRGAGRASVRGRVGMNGAGDLGSVGAAGDDVGVHGCGAVVGADAGSSLVNVGGAGDRVGVGARVGMNGAGDLGSVDAAGDDVGVHGCGAVVGADAGGSLVNVGGAGDCAKASEAVCGTGALTKIGGAGYRVSGCGASVRVGANGAGGVANVGDAGDRGGAGDAGALAGADGSGCFTNIGGAGDFAGDCGTGALVGADGDVGLVGVSEATSLVGLCGADAVSVEAFDLPDAKDGTTAAQVFLPLWQACLTRLKETAAAEEAAKLVRGRSIDENAKEFVEEAADDLLVNLDKERRKEMNRLKQRRSRVKRQAADRDKVFHNELSPEERAACMKRLQQALGPEGLDECVCCMRPVDTSSRRQA